MDISVRLIRAIDSHAHFQVFVSGALAGELTFNKNEWEKMLEDTELWVHVLEPLPPRGSIPPF
jgi:hypothetical protein